MRKYGWLLVVLVLVVGLPLASCELLNPENAQSTAAALEATAATAGGLLPAPFGALALVAANIAGYFLVNRKKPGEPSPPGGPRSSEFWVSMAVGTLALFSEQLGTPIDPIVLASLAGSGGAYAVGRSIAKAKK